MTMTLSHSRNGFGWRASLLGQGWIALCLLAAAAAGIVSTLAPAPDRLSTHIQSLEWRPAIAGEALPVNGWRPFTLRAGADGEPVWFRTTFVLSEQEVRAGVAALDLPGIFSARAYLNGVEIGSKGVPAFRARDEIPGPIDVALPLGPAARVGMNEVLLFTSAYHTHYRPEGLLHGIGILPHGGDAQRSIGRYGVALSQAGVLIAIAAAFPVLSWRRRREVALRWVVGGAALLLLAMAAETARTWWSYPYSYQIVRLGLVWLGLAGFGIALVHAAAARFGVTIRPLVSMGVVAVGAVALSFVTGIDERTRWALLAMLAITIAVAARRASVDGAAQVLIATAAATLTLLLVRHPDVIDNWIYVSGAIMLAAFAWPACKAQETQAMLALDKSAVPVRDVVLVKAAGNYAEVHTADRGCILVRRPLSALELGAPLMRVHRSYIVNLSRARRLLSKTGSRYELEIDDAITAPVSRKLVDAVRAALADRARVA